MKHGLALATAMVCAWVSAGAAVAGDLPAGPALSINPDEQAVYETVLASWLGREQGRQRINQTLSPPPSTADPEVDDCARGLTFPQATAAGQGGKSLVGVQFKRKNIELVDGSGWRPADPGQGIAEGRSVASAVKDGFSHSLISFSQIAFSQNGEDALVKFGMVCGRLCGTGSTLRLHRTRGVWTVANRCGGWIS